MCFLLLLQLFDLQGSLGGDLALQDEYIFIHIC